MKKLITLSVKKDGAIKIDLGKEPKSIFYLVSVLTSCIQNLCKNGYEQEEKNYDKKQNEHRNKSKS